MEAEYSPRLNRIAAAFERSRFERFELRWKGGMLRLQKGSGGTAPATETIKAPRVGIFRAIAEAAVTAGIPVARDVPLGYIDVLGDRHIVKMPVAGTVIECCVGDGTFVEYGAPLFRIVGSAQEQSWPT